MGIAYVRARSAWRRMRSRSSHGHVTFEDVKREENKNNNNIRTLRSGEIELASDVARQVVPA